MLLKQTFTQHQLIQALNTAILFKKNTIASALLTKITNNTVGSGQDTPLKWQTSTGNNMMVVQLVSVKTINIKGDTLQPIMNAILAENIMIVGLLLHGGKMNASEQYMLKQRFLIIPLS